MWYTLKLFVRSIKREKTLSSITIGGYAISMAVIFILVSFIISEKSINRGFPNIQDIYRVKRGVKNAMIPETLLEDVKRDVPGIKKMCLYSIGEALYKVDDKRITARFAAANDDFLDIFSFHFISKSGNPTLEVKNNIILTKSFSEQLFGAKNPVGEILEVENEQLNIVGVITDVPENSSFSFDAITSLNKAVSKNSLGYNDEHHNLFKSFVQLDPKANPGNVNSRISGMLEHWQAFKDEKLTLQPFKEVYFDIPMNDDMDHANVGMIYLLSSIAVIILFMTIFNYVNLTVSKGYERLSEIGIKKTTGASKRNIFNQFIYESLFISFFAMTLAIFLGTMFSPLFSNILGKKIEIFQLFSQPWILLTGLSVFLIIGFISGLYPALVISGIPPIKILNHQGVKKRNNRAGIIAFQFFITIVLIISLLVINRQITFVKNKDMGFDQELMVKLNLNGNSAPKWEVLKNKLLSNPTIVSVTASHGTPLAIYGTAGGRINDSGDKKIENVREINVDQDFIKTFGLTLLAGRNIEATDSNTCIINEQLYNELGWEDYEGKKVFESRVVGIVKDFNYLDLKNKIGFLRLKKLDGNPTDLSIKISDNIAKNMEFIQQQFHEIAPGTPFSYRFYDDWIQSTYQKQEEQAYAIKLFAILAIVIACLGLIGLAENVTNKKIKEIGIRKVNGAKISEILTMLNKDFVKWVGIAFVVAIPIAYYAMHMWLENFAYKTSLSWWIFVLAGLLALGIALLTVSWQSWRAATRNPVEALRYE